MLNALADAERAILSYGAAAATAARTRAALDDVRVLVDRERLLEAAGRSSSLELLLAAEDQCLERESADPMAYRMKLDSRRALWADPTVRLVAFRRLGVAALEMRTARADPR